MKFALVSCAILLMTASNNRSNNVVACKRQAERPRINKDFSYPKSFDTLKYETPYPAKSLAGIVTDSNEAVLEKVLVERLRPDWQDRIEATFTHSDGAFSFSRHSKGIQFLRLSKPGFNTILVKVVIKRRLKSQLHFQLGVSH